jgi:hypothetical protein
LFQEIKEKVYKKIQLNRDEFTRQKPGAVFDPIEDKDISEEIIKECQKYNYTSTNYFIKFLDQYEVKVSPGSSIVQSVIDYLMLDGTKNDGMQFNI